MQVLQIRQLHIQAHLQGSCAPAKLFQLTRSYMLNSKQMQTDLSCSTAIYSEPFWRSKASLARS